MSQSDTPTAMSDWQVGDLARYIGENGKSGTSGLPIGSIHRVMGVHRHPFFGYIGIDIGRRLPVLATSFEPIRPADPEFVERIKRVRVGA